MRILSLRWIFLLIAVAGAARCVFLVATPTCIGLTASCALAWFLMSRRKIISIDRATIGLPPRS